MKHSKSIALLFAGLSFLLAGCEKEVPEAVPAPFKMHRKYRLADVQANFPIDLNFDGVENVDLTKEADDFRDCFVYFADKEATITWPESQVGGYPFSTSEIPFVYTGQDIKYFLVSRHYTYLVMRGDSTYSSIYFVEIREKKEINNYFEFQPPTMMLLDKKQNTLTFPFSHAWQRFMIKEGVKGRSFSVVFKPDPASQTFEPDF